MSNFSVERTKFMLSDPFYCLPEVSSCYTVKHEPMITEDQFIDTAERLIKEVGARQYLSCLLKNLKGESLYE